jgi:hypothetical protein
MSGYGKITNVEVSADGGKSWAKAALANVAIASAYSVFINLDPSASRRAARAFSPPPPAFGERRHRGLARRLVAVRRRAVFVVLECDTSTTAPPALPQPS